MNTNNAKSNRIATTAKLVFAASAMAVGAMALTPAMSTAETNNGGGSGEWDIGKYDDCLADNLSASNLMSDAVYKYCCGKSGGVWSGNKCVAPPAAQGTNNRNEVRPDQEVDVNEPTPGTVPGTRVLDVDVRPGKAYAPNSPSTSTGDPDGVHTGGGSDPDGGSSSTG